MSSLLNLKKDGWFEPASQLVLPELSIEQLTKIKNKEEVMVRQGDNMILIYLTANTDVNNIKVENIVIRTIPSYYLDRKSQYQEEA